MKRLPVVLGAVLVTAGGGVGVLLAANSSGPEDAALASGFAARVDRVATSPQLKSVDGVALQRGAVQVGVSGDGGSDAAVAEWEGVLSAVAAAGQAAAPSISVQVANAAGEVTGGVTTPVRLGEFARLAAIHVDPVADRQKLESGAAKSGARILAITPGALGAISVTVVGDPDPIGLAKEAGQRLYPVLESIVSQNRPYLVRVVDAAGHDLVVLSWNPAVGEADGMGTAWEASGIESDTIVGRVTPTPGAK